MGYRQGIWRVFLGDEFDHLLSETPSEVDLEEENFPLRIGDSWLEETDSEVGEEELNEDFGLAAIFEASLDPEERRGLGAGACCLAEDSGTANLGEELGPGKKWPDLVRLGDLLTEAQREALWKVLE